MPPTDADFEQRFQRLAAAWRAQSRALSSAAAMAMLPAYQKIIGMGPPVVPLLLRELEREPAHWHWALWAITDCDPVPVRAAGRLRDVAEAWLAWGRQQGLTW